MNNIKNYVSVNKYFIVAVAVIIIVIISVQFRLYKYFTKEEPIETPKIKIKSKKHKQVKQQVKPTVPTIKDTPKRVTFATDTKKEVTNNEDVDSLIDVCSLDNISKVDTFSDVPSEIANLDGYSDNSKIFEKAQ